jgi:hypothetical protein
MSFLKKLASHAAFVIGLAGSVTVAAQSPASASKEGNPSTAFRHGDYNITLLPPEYKADTTILKGTFFSGDDLKEIRFSSKLYKRVRTDKDSILLKKIVDNIAICNDGPHKNASGTFFINPITMHMAGSGHAVSKRNPDSDTLKADFINNAIGKVKRVNGDIDSGHADATPATVSQQHFNDTTILVINNQLFPEAIVDHNKFRVRRTKLPDGRTVVFRPTSSGEARTDTLDAPKIR